MSTRVEHASLLGKAGSFKPKSAYRSDITIPFLRNVTWTISNLCRNKNPSPPIEVVRMCMPTIRQLVQHSDSEILGSNLFLLE